MDKPTASMIGKRRNVAACIAMVGGVFVLGYTATAVRASEAAREPLEIPKSTDPDYVNDPRVTNLRGPLVKALRKAAVKGFVEVACVLGDREGKAFAVQLELAVEVGGWPTWGVKERAYDGEKPVGVGLLVPSKVPPHAASLRAAFKAVGIPMSPDIERPDVPERVVILIVGNKPN